MGELESRHARRVERNRLRPARGHRGIGPGRAADEIDVVPIREHDVEVVALVHRKDREPVAGREALGPVEDEAGVERGGRDRRSVHGADRNLGRPVRGIVRRAPDVEIAPVPAREGSEKRPVALQHAVTAHVVHDAGRRALDVAALREGQPVVRLRHVHVVEPSLGEGHLAKAHVERLLAARHVPLAVQRRGREGHRNPVVAAVGRDRERRRAQPEAGHVHAPGRLDSGRDAGNRRHQVEGIAQREVHVAAAQPGVGLGLPGVRGFLRAVGLAEIGEVGSAVIRAPEVHAARDAADRSDVDRAEAIDLDLGLVVLVHEDQAALLRGQLDLGLEAEVEPLVRRGAEIIRGLRRAGTECRDSCVGLVDRPVDEH